MKIEKVGNRYRVKHKIGFYLYGETKKEILQKITILENMKNKEWFYNRVKSKLEKASYKC